MNVIRPRKPFIIPAVILSERNIPNAIALTSCRVLSFKSSILMEIQQRDLGLSDYLLKQMAKTVRDSIFFKSAIDQVMRNKEF